MTLSTPHLNVVAVIAAKNSGRIGHTVRSLASTNALQEIVVVDDGSSDDTAERAMAAGASVLRFERNRGKGAAVAEGIRRRPNADAYLLVDGDLAETAAAVTELIRPVAQDESDLAVAVFPSAGTKGGFGVVKNASRRIISSLCGTSVREPLSGQRCIRGELARSLKLAPRFGVEVAMTVDAVRLGARIVEIELPLDHEHTGRSIAGIRHRMTQGIDIVRAAIPRVGTPTMRNVACIGMLVLLVALATFCGGRSAPATPAFSSAERTSGRFMLVLVAHSTAEDLLGGDIGAMSDQAKRSGAVLASRVPSNPSDVISAAATLSAGAPVKMTSDAVDRTVGEASGLAGASVSTIGEEPEPVRLIPNGAGAKVVTVLTPSEDSRSYGQVGALGDVMRDAGVRVGYIGARVGGNPNDAPGAIVGADSDGQLAYEDRGSIPAGSADSEAITNRLDAIGKALQRTQFVVVDTGVATPELVRAATENDSVSEPPGGGAAGQDADSRMEAARRSSLRITDQFVGRLMARYSDVPTLIVSVAPTGKWELTYVLSVDGASGAIGSPSTRRVGEAVLTDVTATIVNALSLEQPIHMVGSSLTVDETVRPFPVIESLVHRTAYRETIYVSVIITFVVIQALVYLGALWGLRRSERLGVRPPRSVGAAQVVAVLSLSFVVSAFIYRLMPVWWQQPAVAPVGLLVFASVMTAIGWRMRRTLVSPLVWICGIGVFVLSIDAVTSGLFEHISLLGYSPVTAARFYGMGNMGYAILGACTIVLATAWMDDAPTRAEGIVRAGCLFAWVTYVDVAPRLGADFGGALTMAPAFLLLLVAWARIDWTQRRRWAAFGGVLGLVAFVIAVAVVTGGSTHVGRVAEGGWGGLVDVVRRKLETNLRVMRITTWAWMVPIVMIFMIGSILSSGGWRRVVGQDRTWGFGLIGLLGFGLLGGALNDSGIVIPALVLVVVGALMMMIRVRRPFAGAVELAVNTAHPEVGTLNRGMFESSK